MPDPPLGLAKNVPVSSNEGQSGGIRIGGRPDFFRFERESRGDENGVRRPRWGFIFAEYFYSGRSAERHKKPVIQVTCLKSAHDPAEGLLLHYADVIGSVIFRGHMIERVRSLYLRNEMKYDKWGAQGKLLAVLEVFRREGIVMDREKLEKFVNIAFPRTFSCERVPLKGEVIPSQALLRAHRSFILNLFKEHDLPPDRLERMALEETAQRFCLDAEFLRSYLK